MSKATADAVDLIAELMAQMTRQIDRERTGRQSTGTTQAEAMSDAEIDAILTRVFGA